MDKMLGRIRGLPGFRLIVEKDSLVADAAQEWAGGLALQARVDAFGLSQDLYANEAASARRLRMCWYATHALFVFAGPRNSTSQQPPMLQVASLAGLDIRRCLAD